MIEYENLFKLNQTFLKDYESSFSQTLESGWFILGKNVQQFEQQFGNYCDNHSFVGLASGLDALMLSLKTLSLPLNSEVIVPSNTYIATILAILQAGLRPVLVEPELATYNIDPSKIEEKITKNTKAIIVVHLYGKACKMDHICEISNRRGLFLIEDCAQSHGAKFKDKKTGTFGDFGAFSFYPTKNLGALGDAGGVIVKSAEHEKIMRKLRNYGSEVKYYNDLIGYNSRLDEIQAGFLSIKLKKLDEINEHKRMLADLYLKNLKDDFIKPVVDKDYFDVYHIFNIRHPRRDELREYLLKKNIKTEIHYPVSPHKQKAMLGILNHEDYPISSEIHATTLSLPISYFHIGDDVAKVIEAMNAF